ncbi:hypothetical protein A5742_17415 [Mycolicibacterium fortuitum]|uniref:Uncharacterized protein n=1 Tax=Mycolicibacterium fortuitum TaxID=1766 RepID=A0ABD6QTG3_MYCFO|nr:hypothetical protein A5742_17415 [Mycolicibacterium fortuitum]
MAIRTGIWLLIAAHDLEQNTAEPRVLLDDDTAVALMSEIDCVAFETTSRSPYLLFARRCH